MNRYIFLYGILLLLFSCNGAADEKPKNALSYFDLGGYIRKEARRLSDKDPLVTKTAGVNGVYETRRLKIADWERELSLLANADINKASWRAAFTVSKPEGRTIYRSDDEKIPVKEVTIITANQQVKGILVMIRNSNSLYTSADSLAYYPDSLYRISKSQQIKLLSEKKYDIVLKF